MAEKITDTAILKCDKGTLPSTLTVTSHTFCYLDGKLVATEQDVQPNQNIKPFGQCRLKPSLFGYRACVPSPVAWQNPTLKDEVCGHRILTENSTCSCATGGVISIEDKGHTETHETE